jgi:hypothetical protein
MALEHGTAYSLAYLRICMPFWTIHQHMIVKGFKETCVSKIIRTTFIVIPHTIKYRVQTDNSKLAWKEREIPFVIVEKVTYRKMTNLKLV